MQNWGRLQGHSGPYRKRKTSDGPAQASSQQDLAQEDDVVVLEDVEEPQGRLGALGGSFKRRSSLQAMSPDGADSSARSFPGMENNLASAGKTMSMDALGLHAKGVSSSRSSSPVNSARLSSFSAQSVSSSIASTSEGVQEGSSSPELVRSRSRSASGGLQEGLASEEMQRISVVGGLSSPIRSAQNKNGREKNGRKWYEERAFRWTLSLCFVGFGIIFLMRRRGRSPEGEATDMDRLPSVNHHQTHPLLSIAIIGAILIAVTMLVKRGLTRRLGGESVLMVPADEDLSHTVERARAEWDAGRFAAMRAPGSPHLLPTSAQRKWAENL